MRICSGTSGFVSLLKVSEYIPKIFHRNSRCYPHDLEVTFPHLSYPWMVNPRNPRPFLQKYFTSFDWETRPGKGGLFFGGFFYFFFGGIFSRFLQGRKEGRKEEKKEGNGKNSQKKTGKKSQIKLQPPGKWDGLCAYFHMGDALSDGKINSISWVASKTMDEFIHG